MSGHHFQNFRSLSRCSGTSEHQHTDYYSTLSTTAHCLLLRLLLRIDYYCTLTLLAFPQSGDDKSDLIPTTSEAT